MPLGVSWRRWEISERMPGPNELVIASAPLRLPLGGGGTDLPFYADHHGGEISVAAISPTVNVVARLGRTDGTSRFSHERTETVAAGRPFENGFVREALTMVGLTEPCEITSLGSVPSGSGLGSSGAFTVALLAAVHALIDQYPSPVELAEMAFRLENQRLGRPVGRQDHFASALGGVNHLSIGRSGRVEVHALPESAVAASGLDRLLLFYTGKTRNSGPHLLPSANERRTEQLHETRALGLLTLDALRAGDRDELPRLIDRHWTLKRKRESESPWVRLIDDARDLGAQAGKTVGAGGGGFVLLVAERSQAPALITHMAERGLVPLDFDITPHGVTTRLVPVGSPVITSKGIS